jgi:hypothetical protein
MLIATAAYLLTRELELRKQRAQGYPVSGTPESAQLFSHRVLTVGSMFLAYDSTPNDSAIWLMRPPGMFTQLTTENLVHWNDPGNVIWWNVGSASADMLIEFAPDRIGDVLLVHRIAKVVSGLHQRRAGNDREPLELGWADASEAFRDVGGRPGNGLFQLSASFPVAR